MRIQKRRRPHPNYRKISSMFRRFRRLLRQRYAPSPLTFQSLRPKLSVISIFRYERNETLSSPE